MDEILETYTPPEVMKKYFSMGRFGNDKFGCPGLLPFLLSKLKMKVCVIFFLFIVYINAQGRTDMKGLIQSTTRKDFLRFQVWMSEKSNRELRLESQRTGKTISLMILISDADQLSMKQIVCKPGTVL